MAEMRRISRAFPPLRGERSPARRGRLRPASILSPPLLVCLLAAPALAASGQPAPVSPGAREQVTAVSEVCPTFNWAGVEGAVAYDLAVFAAPSLPGDATASHPEAIPLRPIIERRIPGGALGWTPSAAQCLQRGGAYGWVVRAVGPDGVGAWSEAHSFRVANRTSEEEVRSALEVLREYLAEGGDDPSTGAASDSADRAANGSAARGEDRLATPAALSGLDVGHRSRAYLSVGTTGTGPPPPPPPPIEFFSVDHTGSASAPTVRANFFAGDGSAVTNVSAARWGGFLFPGPLVDGTHSHPLIPSSLCASCSFKPVPGCAELCEVHQPAADSLESRCHVRVYDSGGPSADYGNNENSLLHLCWPNQVAFDLIFTSFATEDAKDYLYVFNGLGNPTNRCAATPPVPDTGQTLVAILTGNIPFQQIQVTTGCAALLFCSDGANTTSGWEADMYAGSAVPPPWSACY